MKYLKIIMRYLGWLRYPKHIIFIKTAKGQSLALCLYYRLKGLNMGDEVSLNSPQLLSPLPGANSIGTVLLSQGGMIYTLVLSGMMADILFGSALISNVSLYNDRTGHLLVNEDEVINYEVSLNVLKNL
jgi:hypothetical protein